MKTFKLHFLFGLFIGIVFLFSSKSYSQSIADLRINEILVINDSNYVDDFGSRSSWIEIFNSAYNYVNIAGCYLTNDLKNPKKYQIPKGDQIGRAHV